MKKLSTFLILVISLLLSTGAAFAQTHAVYFCGERIPLSNDFVYNKLMNVLKKQVNVVNLPKLRERARNYFPIIERYLREHGLPQDLKYIPIVESGFISYARSHVGASGFWQFMPATATQYGLQISGGFDEREDIVKSTKAACRLLKDYYNFILKNRGVASWSLTAAAYNFGIGNVNNAIKKQGANYFTMQLNEETSLYVYKIIAVKELFEYPEIYMKNFGYNIFDPKALPKPTRGDDSDAAFKTVDLQKNDELYEKEVAKVKYEFVLAYVDKVPKNFEDGELITVTLLEDLNTKIRFAAKGQSFSIPAWKVDGRIVADIGFGHDVILYDIDQKKGIDVDKLERSKRTNVVLKNVVY